MNPSPDHETHARQRSWALEAQGRLPAGYTEHHYPLTGDELQQLRLYKTALELAEGPDDFIAILRTGKVPRAWYQKRLAEILRGR